MEASNGRRKLAFFAVNIIVCCMLFLLIGNCIKTGPYWGENVDHRLMNPRLTSTPRSCNERNEQKFVLIFSYERSGSSFLGWAIDQHPAVFYVYEPLNQQSGPNRSMTFPRNTKIDDKILDLEAEVYKQIQLCNLDNLPRECDIMRHTLLHHARNLIYMEKFSKCIESEKKNPFGIRKLDYCTQGMLGLCKSRQVVLAKEVRGTMEGLSRYLNTLKCSNNVKVIHLLRDPRGEINSRENAKWTHFAKYRQSKKYDFISAMCQRMQKDISIRHELEKKYPNMFVQVRYEDFVGDVNTTIGALLKFIDLPFFPYHQNTLKLKSENSSDYVNKWKSTLDRSLQEKIDEQCVGVYNLLGYQKIIRTEKTYT
ncbi:unnamed protein product [Owenia fusiformis]|uniref:Sulfotransferase n=1 Tax=Owenia fusiformis TaxID=6347 RepID=A0A8S4PX66_OWEFU|nr:unnamed protein product [Owenia fusiformis]